MELITKDLYKLDEVLDIGNYSLLSINKNKSSDIGNIAIALFVTSYSRVIMSQYKNSKDFNLFYSDTDSIIIDKPLPNELVDKKTLGLMKLESKYTFFSSIGSKTRIGVDSDNNITCKLKGFKHKISYLEFLSLLNFNSSLTLSQEKWFRSFKNSNILIKDSPYNLKSLDTRRIGFFNNNILVATTNHIIQES